MHQAVEGNYGLKLDITHKIKESTDQTSKITEYQIAAADGWNVERDYYVLEDPQTASYKSVKVDCYKSGNFFYYNNGELVVDNNQLQTLNRDYYDINGNSVYLYKPNTYYYKDYVKDERQTITENRIYYALGKNGYSKVNLLSINTSKVLYEENSLEPVLELKTETPYYLSPENKEAYYIYEPRKYYYLRSDDFKLDSSNGFNPQETYFLPVNNIVDVTFDNYKTFADEELYYKNNDEDILVYPHGKDSGFNENKTYYNKVYKIIDKEINYEPSKYYILHNDTYVLDSSNGFDKNKEYYEKQYVKIDVDEKTNVSTVFYKEEDGTYKKPTEIKNTVQYYKEEYVLTLVTYDTYKPKYFYYKDEKGKFVLDESNGFNSKEVYYKIGFEEIQLSSETYVPASYYYKNENNKYLLDTSNGFDENKVYYLTKKNNDYIQIRNVTKNNYQPYKYYTAEIINQSTKRTIYLNVKDMLGNPYQFDGYYEQEKVFDISEYGEITGIKLSFFQTKQSFKREDGELFAAADHANLFVKNIKIFLGMDISKIEDEFLQLFTFDGLDYQATTNEVDNLKKIYLKWAHKENDKICVFDKDNIDEFVQQEIEDVEWAIDNNNGILPEIKETEAINTQFEMRLDGSETEKEDRNYYERIVVLANLDENDIPTGQYNIEFKQNFLEEYSVDREYFIKDYYLYDDDFSGYYDSDETLYLRTLNIVPEGTAYDPAKTYYYLDELNSYTEAIITDNLFNFSDGKEYYVYEFLPIDLNESINKEECYQIGYKKIEVTKETQLYDLYYADYVRNEQGKYNIEYIKPKEFIYEPYKYYYVYIDPKELFEIRWYKYVLGAPSADEYSGVYWQRQNPNDIHQFEYVLYPDAVYNAVERIKAIVLFNGQPYKTDILEFTNNSPIIDLPTVEQENALRMKFMDGSLGNYYLYDESNSLIDKGQGAQTRTIKLLFDLEDFSSQSLLTEAEKVTWIFPLENTMIKVATGLTDGIYSVVGNTGYIIDMEQRSEYCLNYTIDTYYSYSKNNNTITCNIEKDGNLYSAAIELSFGQSGSNGSEYTLALDLLSSDGVVTLYPTGEDVPLYYLTLEEVSEIKKDGTIYYQTKEETEYIPLKHISEYDENNIYYIYKTNENDEKVLIELNLGGWDGRKQLYIQESNNIYKQISIIEWVELEEKPVLYYRDLNNNSYLSIDSSFNYNGSTIYYAETHNIYIQINIDEYNKNQPVYAKTKYEKVTANTPKQDKYFILSEEESSEDKPIYIETNVTGMQEDLIVATLYDQNHQKINISGYDIDWEWMHEQNLFTIGKKDNTTISLIKNNDNSINPQNEICIIKASLKNWGNGYDLVAYLPVPVRETFGPVRFQGPTQIIYSTTGNPNYYKDDICLYYNNSKGQDIKYPISSNTIKMYPEPNGNYVPTLEFKEQDTGDMFCRIVPSSLYIDGVVPFGIQCFYDGKWLWTQPILYMQNRYFSSTINQWDGKLNVDEDNNTILAKMIGAGSKNNENQFSGVLLGDWTGNVNQNDSSASIAKRTGLYGFHEGATSFGFMEDGTGFIGKSGSGRILFDGDSGTITSGEWTNKKVGMYLDIDDGFLLMQNADGQYIKLDSEANSGRETPENSLRPTAPTAFPRTGGQGEYPFVIRGNSKNFTKIGWNGDLKLSGSKHGSEEDSDSQFISLDAAAATFPLNINAHFGVAWDGSLLISKQGQNQWANLDSLYDTSVNYKKPNFADGAFYNDDARTVDKDKTNEFDYSWVKPTSYTGLLATPDGDIYLSKRLVIGEKFAANKNGKIRASEAFFKGCYADAFEVKYTEGLDMEPGYNNHELDNKNINIPYMDFDKDIKSLGKMGAIYGSADDTSTTVNLGITTNKTLVAHNYDAEKSYVPSILMQTYGNFRVSCLDNGGDDTLHPGDMYFEGKDFNVYPTGNVHIQHKGKANNNNYMNILSRGDVNILTGSGDISKSIFLGRSANSLDASAGPNYINGVNLGTKQIDDKSWINRTELYAKTTNIGMGSVIWVDNDKITLKHASTSGSSLNNNNNNNSSNNNNNNNNNNSTGNLFKDDGTVDWDKVIKETGKRPEDFIPTVKAEDINWELIKIHFNKTKEDFAASNGELNLIKFNDFFHSSITINTIITGDGEVNYVPAGASDTNTDESTNNYDFSADMVKADGNSIEIDSNSIVVSNKKMSSTNSPGKIQLISDTQLRGAIELIASAGTAQKLQSSIKLTNAIVESVPTSTIDIEAPGTMSTINLTGGKYQLVLGYNSEYMGHVLYTDTPKEQQHGIYARFA